LRTVLSLCSGGWSRAGFHSLTSLAHRWFSKPCCSSKSFVHDTGYILDIDWLHNFDHVFCQLVLLRILIIDTVRPYPCCQYSCSCFSKFHCVCNKKQCNKKAGYVKYPWRVVLKFYSELTYRFSVLDHMYVGFTQANWNLKILIFHGHLLAAPYNFFTLASNLYIVDLGG
jgi:hypothetical protein